MMTLKNDAEIPLSFGIICSGNVGSRTIIRKSKTFTKNLQLGFKLFIFYFASSTLNSVIFTTKFASFFIEFKLNSTNFCQVQKNLKFIQLFFWRRNLRPGNFKLGFGKERACELQLCSLHFRCKPSQSQ